MMEHSQIASEHEDAGEYEQAATHYALCAFHHMVNTNFENERSLLISATILLRSMSCDAIVNNFTRATFIFEFAKVIFKHRRAETTDVVLEGLTYEWIGDGFLMLNDERALECYKEASERYVNVRPTHPWGSEEEYDYAEWALQRYLDSKGKSLPEYSSQYFQERIEYKTSLAKELL